MLKPIVKERGVNESERELGVIVDNTFLSLWSFPCIYTDEGLNRNGIGKEFSDLVVYFNNTLIIFSDKNIGFQEHQPLAIAWRRWFQKSVFATVRQLHGAEKSVRERPGNIYLDKRCTQTFPYDLSSDNLKIHLVGITYNSSAPAKKYFSKVGGNEVSSGSLLGCYTLLPNELIKRPFVIGDVDPGKTFVHILDVNSFRLVLSELATIRDFISYLEAKEDAIRRRSLNMVMGEEDLLGHYLIETGAKGFGRIELPVGESNVAFVIPEGEWANLQNSVVGLVRKAAKIQSEPWNSILKDFSNSVTDALVGEGAHLPLAVHEQAVRSLASENLHARAALARALVEKYETTPVNIRSARLVFSPCDPGRLYVFLMYPRGSGNYAVYRKERTAYMQLYGLVAFYQNPKAREIVVLGADCKGSVGSSESLLVIDGTVPLTAAGRKDAVKVMREHNILFDMRTPKRQASALNDSRSFGRNEACPCQSGLKYKKCCLR
jgi:hypothetical protein